MKELTSQEKALLAFMLNGRIMETEGLSKLSSERGQISEERRISYVVENQLLINIRAKLIDNKA